MLPDYLTPAEARAYLNLGRSTLYDLVRRGELTAVRFGKVLRIPREALKK
jgi:excisionase family DNA binding protein